MIPLEWVRRLAAQIGGLPRRPAGPRGVGYDWERRAERFLRGNGYRILHRNYTTRAGEIDFVAEEDGVLCFVEVKGRGGDAFGSPADAVDLEKQRRLCRAAEGYLARRRGPAPRCRFDVVAITAAKPEPRISLLRDAFRGPAPRRRRESSVVNRKS